MKRWQPAAANPFSGRTREEFPRSANLALFSAFYKQVSNILIISGGVAGVPTWQFLIRVTSKLVTFPYQMRGQMSGTLTLYNVLCKQLSDFLISGERSEECQPGTVQCFLQVMEALAHII